MGALLQFHHDGPGEPTLNDLARRFGVPVSSFDPEYGVVLIDEDEGLWVALIDDDAAADLAAALTEDDVDRGAGVFADPRIEPIDDGAGAEGDADTAGEPTD